MFSPSSRVPIHVPLAERLGTYGVLLRAYLEQLLPRTPPLEAFYGILAYHLGWVDAQLQLRDARPGKSLRPCLCLLVGESQGAGLDSLLPIAAGIELLHNFSLIHDDIQDRSETRRGRPTVWTVWGVAQAINAGDAMFSLAHTAWFRSDLGHDDPTGHAELLSSLEATVLRLCEGQFLDMRGERRLETTSRQYLDMIGAKTAALIGESAWCGARAATNASQVLRSSRDFGHELGLAFQIRDDILGIWGDEDETGKSAATDIESRKMTLPVILAMEQGGASLSRALRDLYGETSGTQANGEIRALLDQARAKELAAAEEETHWDAAMRALDAIPLDATWRTLLADYARTFVGRRA